jgi:hypothetical protein
LEEEVINNQNVVDKLLFRFLVHSGGGIDERTAQNLLEEEVINEHKMYIVSRIRGLADLWSV